MGSTGEAAIAELSSCEADLRRYAEERGLTLRSDPAFPDAQPPEEQVGPVRHAVWALIGEMPGGATARLRHQAICGKMIGQDVASATGIGPDLAQKARGAGVGISAGGCAACIYLSSDGWSGRIKGVEIDRMLAAAPAIFNAADRQADSRDGTNA